MNTYVPNYYHKFKCIAEKCRNSCCIGWEIDIDPQSLERFQSLTGPVAQRLKESISFDGDPHFILTPDERCPFLNTKGLCDLICEYGEDVLCDICRDHPRFRNYYSDSVEMGLGLCCEAATDLILNTTEPFELVKLCKNEESSFDDEEAYVINKRQKLIDIMKDRTKTIEERFTAVLCETNETNGQNNFKDWCNFYLTLERLDMDWTNLLNKAKNAPVTDFYDFTSTDYRIQAEQLTIYFLYRHMPNAVYDGEVGLWAKFAIFSTEFIFTLAQIISSGVNFKNTLMDICRMYSAEIEYSDENIEKITDEFY